MKKRLLSLVLVFSFIFGTLPVNVLAGAMQTERSETITGNGKVNVKYLDETDHDLTTLSPSVKIDKEKYPVIAEGQAGKEISKEHLDTTKAPKFIGYKIKTVKTDPVPAPGKTATYTTDGEYTVKFIYEKIDDIKGPLKPTADFPKGYVAVMFFADDLENDRGEFAGNNKDGNKREVVYAVNPKNTEIDTDAMTLKGKKADGETNINIKFPTYSVKAASEATWKKNDTVPWVMEPKGAIKADRKIDVDKLGEKQNLTFTAQYEGLKIADIIKKANLAPVTLKVWVGDNTIPWKKGVKVADTVTDEKFKEKIEGYLDDAKTSYKDNTTSARTSQGEAVSKPITGTIRVTFSDNSFIDVADQELYVIPHVTFSTNDKAPDNAIEVTFKLGEGVKAGSTIGGDPAVEYKKYKVKPNLNIDTYNIVAGTNIFGNINAQVTDNKKYAGVVWEGQTAKKPEDHVVTKSNKVFTAKATKIFTVKHEFVSGTEGKALPTKGMPNVPEAVTGKEVGSRVDAPTKTYKDVKVAEGTWTFKGWSPNTLTVKEDESKNVFTGTWTFTESLASILKGKLSPQDIKVWKDDKIDWEKGIEKDENGLTDEQKKLIKKEFTHFEKGLKVDGKAKFEDATSSKRNSKTANSNKRQSPNQDPIQTPFNGTIKVTFSDGSELLVENQNLYVSEHMTGKDNKNAPDDAVGVIFKLGEGVKAGTTIGGDPAVEYRKYKVKPNLNIDTYNIVAGTNIFGNINAQVTDNKKYAGVVWEGQTAKKPEDHVVTDSNKVFTAKATKIFTVKHEFVSGTKGKTLPTTGMPNVPEAVTGKEVGSRVNAPTTTYKDVKVAEGTWTFKGWSPATLRVSETDKDNKFVGKWEFTPDKKTVNLTFEFYKKKDSGNVQQPYNALGDFKKPDLKNLTGQDVGAEITLPKYQGQTVNTGDLQGTWEFDGWYRGDKKLTNAKVSAIDAENKLVGKWILTETKTAIVSHEFKIDPSIVGNDKVVKPTHELPQGVKNQKRQQTTNYVGSIVNPISKPAFTAVPETINGKQGTWTFKEWTPKELTVNKEEAKNVFTGTWTWTEKGKVEVKYVFETNPKTKTLPEALKALKPEDRVGDKAVYEDNKPADPKAPDTSSEAAQKALVEMKGGNKVGEWKAGNWVKTTDAKGNITYTLTWTFEEVKKDKPRPSTPTRPSTPSTPSTPTTPSTPVRVNGKDRVDTAIEISKKYFGQAERVIIVDASNFPDAMAASALAKQLKAPILLTKSNNLDSRVAAEIKRLGAHNVTVIGGKSSVSDGALNQISKFDKDGVERISGKDRYETSAEVARRLAKITGKTGHAVIASGEVFADALAVGPYAAREGYPILLVKSNSIPKSISDLITEIGVKKVSIVGGYGSVSKSLEKSLPLVAERLSGKTRYETAIEIASKGLKTSNKVFVANGEQWMDALVIGPVGGLLNMPILLTGANSAPQSLRDHIAKSKIDKITAIGGRSKVSDRVLNELSK